MNRVLFIVEDLSCSGSPLSVLHILENIENFAIKDVFVMCGKNDEDVFMFDKYKKETEKIYLNSIPHLSTKKFKILYFFYLKKILNKIEKLIKTNNYSHIYFNRGIISGRLIKKIKQKYKDITIIFHSLGEIRFNSRYKIVNNNLRRNIFYISRFTDFFIAIAQKCFPSADFIIQGKKIVLHDYTDIDVLNGNKCFSKAGKIVMGQIGYFCPLKNQLFSLNLLKKMIDEGVDASLYLLGYPVDPKYIELMNSCIDANYLKEKVFYVDKDYSKIVFFDKIDILLLPSISEGSPLVVLEASARKTPCLASFAIPEESNVGNLIRMPLDSCDLWLQYLRSEDYKRIYKSFSEETKSFFKKQVHKIFAIKEQN
ncbi:MAG: glycosyltransferase [Bacilli bacterium]